MRSSSPIPFVVRTAAALAAIFVAAATGPFVVFAQRGLTDIPTADPVAEMAAMKLADETAVNLYAADPDFRKPIQINFDSRGRLWVASSEVYPQIEPGQVANDKIVVLEDTNGDGVADKSTVFADGLLIPTGVIPDEQGGAYVAASTELLHYADTNGDGVADVKKVVFSGFGTEDTHHLIHTLRWGPDGCLYFNQSIYIHSHIETAYGTRHLDGGGIWRYRPETGELEIFSKGFVNPWGHIFDAHGESFATDGAYSEGINYVFPDSIFVTSPGAPRWLSGMNPGSPKHCGLEIISGGHFPESWSGDLVTSDFRGHRVCRFTVRPSATTYTSRQQPEIINSSHIAFRPIDARMGPDGALYVADWYNPIIQHGEVDFRDERRDRVHGRIWRVHFPDRPLDKLPDFAAASTDQLISMLEDQSLAVRQFARQHLWPKVAADADAVLAEVVRWRDAAETAELKASRALEHQWLGEVAGRFAKDSFELIAAGPSGPNWRPSLRSAVRSGGPADEAVWARIVAAALGDDPALRLEAVVALGQVGDGAAALEAARTLIAAAERHRTASPDPTLDFVLWQSLRMLSGTWVGALREGRLDWQPHAGGLAFAVSAAASGEAADAVMPLLASDQLSPPQQQLLVETIAASGDPQALGKLLSIALADGGDSNQQQLGAVAAKTLEQLVQRTGRERGAVPADAAKLLAQRFSAVDRLPVDEAAKNSVVTAAGLWKAEAMLPTLLELAKPGTQQTTLVTTIRALGQLENPAALAALQKWVDEGVISGNQDAAIEAAVSLSVRYPGRSAAAAVKLIAELSSDGSANTLLVALKPNQAVAKAIAAKLDEEAATKVVLATDRARSLLAAVRGAGGDAAIEKAISAAGRLDKAGWEPSPELATEILAAVKTHGNPGRGETIYRRSQLQCINCHAIGTAGGLVGPNLISVGSSSQPDYVLESLWLPDARLKEGYNTLAILTDDGRVTSGIPIGRSDAVVRLRLADGKEVEIPTDSIDDEQPGKSLMPAGLIDSLTKDELVDLVAFLTALGRDPDFTVSTDLMIRNFETLTFSPDANRVLNRTSTDAVASENAAFVWRPVTTRVNGTLPVEELDRFKQHSTSPFSSFVRFEFIVPQGQGSPTIEMPAAAVDVWLDGKPTPVEKIAGAELTPGKHTVVVGINRDQFTGDFRVKLTLR